MNRGTRRALLVVCATRLAEERALAEVIARRVLGRVPVAVLRARSGRGASPWNS